MRYCQEKGAVCQYAGDNLRCRITACVMDGSFRIRITNADRIRAMSDEKLAVFLDGFTCNCIDCRDNDGKNESCPIYNRQRYRYCEPKDIMDWLQSPTKEDT